MSKYDDVMQHLHPRVIIEKVETPHDAARGKYVLRNPVVRSYQEFEAVIIDYMDHHMKELYGNSLPPDLLLAQARELLEQAEGFENMAYTALSGAQGGIGYVLNNLAESYKHRHKKAYFEYIMDTYIDQLDFGQVVELCREFQSRLSGFSPQPFSYIPPEQMAGDFKKILWNYIDSLTRYRNLWVY